MHWLLPTDCQTGKPPAWLTDRQGIGYYHLNPIPYPPLSQAQSSPNPPRGSVAEIEDCGLHNCLQTHHITVVWIE
jgi:hypothetical protein